MDFNEYLSHRLTTSRPLKEFRALLCLLGDPQQTFPCVQIAGTNAKGSTAVFLANILMKAGYRVGLYTSPALNSVNERIRINGRMISDGQLEKCATRVSLAENMYEHEFGGFARMTACAFLAFRDSGVDIAVMETGLGGMMDPVTACNSILSVLTPIGMDHTDVLGDTIEKIAIEKCGIIKPNIPIVSAKQRPPVLNEIKKRAKWLNCVLTVANPAEITSFTIDGAAQTMRYDGYRFTLDLLGQHQRENAQLAVMAAQILNDKGFKIDGAAIELGITAAKWPCRLEHVNGLVLDGAHNVDAMTALRAALKECNPYNEPIVLLSIMQNKNVEGILDELVKFAYGAVCVSVNERAVPAEELCARLKARRLNTKSAASVEEGLALAREMCDSRSILVVTGSLYLAGAVRQMVVGRIKDQ